MGESPGRGKAAAGYIRVSQIGKREGDSFLSPDLQRDRIASWAAYRGYAITEWYVDLDVSGRAGVRRPEFERMMLDARAKKFQVVATYRLSRFGRSVKDTAVRYAELRDLGIGLVSVSEDIDSSTATGGLIQNMLFALAEFESERIGEEWASVHANRRRRGLVHAPRGIYGYHTKGAVIVGVDAEQALVVEAIYRERLGGASWRDLSDQLAAQRVPSPRGEPRWGQTTLLGILRNPSYAGLVKAGDELITADHPAIISRELWEMVQALHPRTARLARYGGGLASGLTVCAGCGYHMARANSGGRRVYRCTAHRHSRACPAPSQVAAHLLDDYLEARVARSIDPRRMPHGGRVRRGKDRRQSLERRVEDANRAIDRLSDERYLIGSLTPADYDRQLARLAERRDEAQRDLDDLATQPRPILDYDWKALPQEARRRVVRSVVERVTIKAGRAPVADRVTITWAH